MVNPVVIRCLSIGFAAVLLTAGWCSVGADDPLPIEAQTKVHRLATTHRSPYDAFAYVNRLPDAPDSGETTTDYTGRILGRLANQEGRILLKLPTGMDRETYQAFKTFLRSDEDGLGRVGNCAACHTPAEFTDFAKHRVTVGGMAEPTPSLRNLNSRQVDLRGVLIAKIAAAKQKQARPADGIDEAYTKMTINEDDVPGLMKFLQSLNDVSDPEFRELILQATILDTSEDG
jgi:hypothetical protein